MYFPEPSGEAIKAVKSGDIKNAVVYQSFRYFMYRFKLGVVPCHRIAHFMYFKFIIFGAVEVEFILDIMRI